MNKFIVILLTIANFMGSLYSQEISTQEEAFVHKINHTITALKNNKSLVWRDFNLSESPIIITFSNQHVYAFGLKSTNPAWEVKSDGELPILFSNLDQWGVSKVSMQDKFNLDGQDVFVFSIDENEKCAFPDRPILVLVHELFHLYQFEHFDKNQDFGRYADQSNIENLSLIALEERILIDFLKAGKGQKLEALKNYMAVNQARNLIMDPSSIAWERFQQVMEGLADYASIEALDTFSIVPQFNGERHLQYLLAGYIHSDDPSELAMKWRHYAVGATLGKALDFLEVPDWKDQIEFKGESQASILEKTIRLSKNESKKRLKRLKKLYGYHQFKSDIEKKVNGFNQMIEGLMQDYEAQEGFVVVLERPREIGINGGGSSYGIFHLENERTVSVKDKSLSVSTDNKWKIELKEIPFLFQNMSGSRILKVDHDLNLILDGKSYSLDYLKTTRENIPFRSLSWDCQTSTFESIDRDGEIFCDENGLSIFFPSNDS